MKTFWIAKDDMYNVFDREPTADDWLDVFREWDNEVGILPQGGFERATGIKLEAGQFCKVKMEIVGAIWELVK